MRKQIFVYGNVSEEVKIEEEVDDGVEELRSLSS